MLRVCLQNIDPHLLLAVFLPVLLFASAFVAHWHTVRRQKVPILLLVSTSACRERLMASLHHVINKICQHSLVDRYSRYSCSHSRCGVS